METLHLKEGWVFKQSKQQSRPQKRWMVLCPTFLFTSGNKKQSEHLKKIPLCSITSIEKKTTDSKTQMIQICTKDKEMYIYTPETDNWLRALCRIAQAPEQKICEMFGKIKEALEVRKDFLLQQNERIYASTRSKMRLEDSAQYPELPDRSQALLTRINSLRQLPVPEVKETSPFELEFRSNCQFLKRFLTQNCTIEKINPEEHTVNRSGLTRAISWKYGGDRVDALAFKVSKDIQLTGVGISRPFKQGQSLTVVSLKILKGRSTNSKAVYAHIGRIQIDFSQDASVQQVPLNLSLRKEQVYTLFLQIEGRTSFKCVDCFDQCKEANVVWEFMNCEFAHPSNNTCVQCGPIANFQFTINN